jgi:hypothetical protein
LNVELAIGEQALVRLRRIELPNFQHRTGKNEETEELIKIFVSGIRTAEKKKKSFDVQSSSFDLVQS